MVKTVLLIGARGFLGKKVLAAVLAKQKYTVKAMLRKGTLENAGNTQVVLGDMMDPDSLKAAFQGVDVVINTANGYMSGHLEVDTVGANNVVDACKACNVKRYIYCSVLTADLATMVEHFHHKKLAEDYMQEQGINYIALRPGGFIDQADDYLGDAIKSGSSFCVSMWNKNVPIGMILTQDLANLFCECIDLPKGADKSSIDVGLSRPIAMVEVASICSEKLSRTIRCFAVPKLLRYSVIYTIGWYSQFWADMMIMFNYFDSGTYVNSVEAQTKWFGVPPTPEAVLNKWIDKLLAEKDQSTQ